METVGKTENGGAGQKETSRLVAALIIVAFALAFSFAYPVLSQATPGEPSVILRFNVFTSKMLDANITPSTINALPGSAVTYRLAFSNRNPVAVALNLSAEVPGGWAVNVPATASVPANGASSVTLTVTSNASSAEGAYKIAVRFASADLSIGGSVVAQYVVGLRATPSVSVSPPSREGVAGSSVSYDVLVTNNDPSDFDPSVIALTAAVPTGWKASFINASPRVAPGAAGSALLTVTSPPDATEGATISINATANKLSGFAIAEYKLTTCGDGVCQLNEICALDCAGEGFFLCNGRCESEADDGVLFSATLAEPASRFIVCSRSASQEECVSAASSNNCGIGKACLCADGSQCLTRCVDTKGAYYMAAQLPGTTRRSNANYSFACPFVNLPELEALRDDFSAGRDFYERARGSFQEAVNTGNATAESVVPCITALDAIISKASTHVSLLDAVIASPAKSNTTDARVRTFELRAEIDNLYRTHCTGASGALRIVTFAPPRTAETGATAASVLNVKNNGTTTFFAVAQCDYFAPSGAQHRVGTQCEQVAPSAVATFTPALRINETGDWSVACSVSGSVESDCSFASLHDATDKLPFSTFTRDVFVTDVSGSIEGSNVICEVRASNPSCTTCRAGTQLCSRLGEANGTARFACPRSAGFFTNITGSVFASEQCVPVAPAEKSIVVSAPGCGNGALDEGEACEPPGSDNNVNVLQTNQTCVGKRLGVRDAFGFCTPACEASQDQFAFSCAAGQCGAECSDGETRNFTVRDSGGSCVCVQQCGAACSFQQCSCETRRTTVTGTNVTTTSGVTITLTLGHSPASPEINETVNISATASTNGTLRSVKIFVDGFLRKQCNIAACTLSDEFQAGTHTYFATAEDESNIVTNPATGTKTFTVRTPEEPAPRRVQRERCSVSIQSKSCEFDAATNRYLAEINVVWQGGAHAHGTIDGDESAAFTRRQFDFAKTLAGPGSKTLRAEVQDAEHDVLCSDTDEIFCTGGTTTGGLSVTRSPADGAKVRVGSVDVTVTVVSPAADVKLAESVDSRISASRLSVSGNTSAANITGPVLSSAGGLSLNVYALTASVSPNKPLVLSYRANIPAEGDYRFAAEATAAAETKRAEATLKATDCGQTFDVFAAGPGGACLSFPTACDVPAGWSIVERCGEEDARKPAESPLLPAVVVIIIFAVLALGFRYRSRIREKLSSIRRRDDELTP